MSRCNLDIFELIAHHLELDQRSLRASASTCSWMRAIAQRHLFRRCIAKNGAACMRLLEVVDMHEDLGESVRELRVTFTKALDDAFYNPSLDRLRLVGHPRGSAAFHALGRLLKKVKCLRTLSLNHVHLGPLADIDSEFALDLPMLTRLELFSCSTDGLYISPLLVDQLPSLLSLTTCDTPIFTGSQNKSMRTPVLQAWKTLQLNELYCDNVTDPVLLVVDEILVLGKLETLSLRKGREADVGSKLRRLLQKVGTSLRHLYLADFDLTVLESSNQAPVWTPDNFPNLTELAIAPPAMSIPLLCRIVSAFGPTNPKSFTVVLNARALGRRPRAEWEPLLRTLSTPPNWLSKKFRLVAHLEPGTPEFHLQIHLMHLRTVFERPLKGVANVQVDIDTLSSPVQLLITRASTSQLA